MDAVVEMGGDIHRLGPAWGDMAKEITEWRSTREGALPPAWGEGDWNNDGVFNSADIVYAMQQGHK